MRKILLVFVVPCVVILLSSAGFAKNTSPSGITQKRDTIHMGVESVRLMQVISKDYLYLTTGVTSSVLREEMKASLRGLDGIIEKLHAPKYQSKETKALLSCITLGRDELKTILKEHYSMDNVKLILDVTGLITEAALRITHQIEMGRA